MPDPTEPDDALLTEVAAHMAAEDVLEEFGPLLLSAVGRLRGLPPRLPRRVATPAPHACACVAPTEAIVVEDQCVS